MDKPRFQAISLARQLFIASYPTIGDASDIRTRYLQCLADATAMMEAEREETAIALQNKPAS